MSIHTFEQITQTLFETGGLYDQAEVMLQRALAADPDHRMAAYLCK